MFVRKSMVELFVDNYTCTNRTGPSDSFMPTYLVTDCKSEYDHLARLSPPSALEEKRVVMDICSIRENIVPNRVKWIPTHVQLADHLTKIRPFHAIVSFLANGLLHLTVCSRATPLSFQALGLPQVAIVIPQENVLIHIPLRIHYNYNSDINATINVMDVMNGPSSKKPLCTEHMTDEHGDKDSNEAAGSKQNKKS